MTYTVENIPAELEKAVQEQLNIEKKDINAVLLEALARGLDLDKKPRMKRDLSDVAGQCTIDETTRAAFESQRQIDPEMWK